MGKKKIVLEVENDSLPECVKRFPLNKVSFIATSGSVSPQRTEHGNEGAGIDIFRIAEEKDGVRYNKDHFPIVEDTKTGEKVLLGPIPDNEHWIDEIPDRFDDLDVVRMRKRSSE